MSVACQLKAPVPPVVRWSALGLCWAGLTAGAAAAAIELVCIDDEATGYGTFQSHNQKVVSNGRGIFMTHIRSRNEPYTAQQWRLSWSRDGGHTFRTLHEATHPTNPAVLESDETDNIYLVRPDFVDGHAYLYRFLAAKDYEEPMIVKIPGGAAGKYAMVRAGALLLYFAHNNTFHRVGVDGSVQANIQLLRAGPRALLQYPLLSLDEAGDLYAAWTTQAHGKYLYWDIHWMRSTDGGQAWTKSDGTPLSLPVVADDTGPAERVTLEDEFEAHTWLSSFVASNGKAHFLYLAQTQPPRQHYVRYDLRTGRRELDRQPEFRGDDIVLMGLDGFFAVDGSVLYCVGREGNRLGCLVSRDQGTTWHDYGRSAAVANPYSIGGCRVVSEEGYILGSFTDQVSSTDAGGTARVYFFRIKAT